MSDFVRAPVTDSELEQWAKTRADDAGHLARELIGHRRAAAVPQGWRCFHCGEVFYEAHSAKLHFGMDQCSDPACKIKMGAEGSLVKALRTAENELADAWAAIHNESTEAAKAYYAQQSRHGDQLRAAEELGYERGLADGRAAALSAVSAPEVEAKDGVVYVEVSGLTGTGKSAVMGEIEIGLRALGLSVEHDADFQSEKNMTHADWQSALDLYKPHVVIRERNIVRSLSSTAKEG